MFQRVSKSSVCIVSTCLNLAAILLRLAAVAQAPCTSYRCRHEWSAAPAWCHISVILKLKDQLILEALKHFTRTQLVPLQGNTPSLGIQHPWAPFECLVWTSQRLTHNGKLVTPTGSTWVILSRAYLRHCIVSWGRKNLVFTWQPDGWIRFRSCHFSKSRSNHLQVSTNQGTQGYPNSWMVYNGNSH